MCKNNFNLQIVYAFYKFQNSWTVWTKSVNGVVPAVRATNYTPN